MTNNDPSLSDVRRRRAEIKKQFAALANEDERLEMVEAVLEQLGGKPPAMPSLGIEADHKQGRFGGGSAQPEKETVESLILIALSDGDWWTANEIQTEVSKLRGKETPMSTISPTLSAMKKDGKIVRDGLKVKSPAEAGPFKNTGEVAASPDAGSRPVTPPNFPRAN